MTFSLLNFRYMATNINKIQGGVNYLDESVEKTMKASTGTNSGDKQIVSKINHGLFLTDIAQAHHFTVQIEGLDMSKFKTPGGTFSEFLPVKSINLNYTSYESMTIPVAIFGDFPLLNRKRVSTIALTCFDTDDNKLEHEIVNWEDSCFPKGRYVAYMESMARKFTYKGYSVKGEETFNISFYVIPSGSVAVSRDYSSNDAKLVTFNLVCVGDGSTCATGDSKPNKTAPKSSKISSAKVNIFSGKTRLSGDEQASLTNQDAYNGGSPVA